MEVVVNFIGNLTIFSVVQLIFVQQDNHRTINFICEDEDYHRDLSNRLMQIASNSLKPTRHFILGSVNTSRGSNTNNQERMLNVVILNDLNNETNICQVRHHILPEDTTIILPRQVYDESKVRNIESWMSLSTKVVVLTQNLSIYFNLFENKQYSKMDLYDPESTRNAIGKIFSVEYTMEFLREQNFSIFFQFVPPRSSVSALGNHFTIVGPDGSLAEALAKSLQVKPIISTDIALIYANYEEWLDDPGVAPRVHYQLYYKKVLTKNVVTIFNKR